MTTPAFSPLSRRTRIQRADAVRREFAAGRMEYAEAVGRLMWIYPSLTMSRLGWAHLLTEDWTDAVHE
jgi:hypothetical protein